MNSAVIVAGGRGSRVGKNIPKQFLKINGEEILSYSVNTFLKHPNINEVIIVSHSDWIDVVSEKYKNCKVIVGGDRRQDSSLNGILATDNLTTNVLIHDAARPFVSTEIITACLEALNHSDGTAPIMKTSNSLIQLENGVASYVDRAKIRELQTPQCFKKKLILDVLSSEIEGTDEIGMVIKIYPNSILKFIPSNKINNKITSDIDLNFFKSFFN